MRARIIVVSLVSVACLIAGWVVWSAISASAQVRTLRGDLNLLRLQVCEELMLTNSTADLFKIEIQALHGIPATDPVVSLEQMSEHHQQAVEEVLRRIYGDEPLVDRRLVHPYCEEATDVAP